MTTPNRRLLKEIHCLLLQQEEKNPIDCDYIIHIDDSNVNIVHALIKAPHDSVYRHKFVRLDIHCPDNYPHAPPQVQFINHDNVRIHPNMYEDGKCCSTILNTWGDNPYEKWTSSMGIETILLTFHSFLDNHPYTYEPGGRDDPSYTVFVQHQSWYTCLIRYLQFESIPLFSKVLRNYLLMNIESVFENLATLSQKYPTGTYETRCFEVDHYHINYARINNIIEDYLGFIEYQDTEKKIEVLEDPSRDYHCTICFDTNTQAHNDVTLSCNHTFHKDCLERHIESNKEVCPMCRHPIEVELLERRPLWIINPLTKRKIKVGGKTYQSLLEHGHLQL